MTEDNLPTILKNISQAKRIAVALPKQLTLDALCAGLAIETSVSSSSTKTGNATTVTLISASSELPATQFLKNQPQVYKTLTNSKGLSIKVSNSHAQPGELRYEKEADGLVISITPSEGEFIDADVSVLPSAANFDLVIILGAANFESLGSIYTDNTKLFFETPNINIDIDPANEYYGTVNLVNTTATSLSEVVMDVIEAMPNALDNEIVATNLLAGIISQTASFRDPKTTPTALLKASRLVEKGAKQQDIIQHLFKTKPLPLLQLWGRALARLVAQPEKQALTAVLTASDIEKTKVGTDELYIVLRDIIEMVTGYSLIVLLAELPNTNGASGVQVLLAGLPHENIAQAAKQLGGNDAKALPLVGKFEYASFLAKQTLPEVQQNISNIIEKRSSAS